MTEAERELPTKKEKAPEPEREELAARPRPGGTRCPFCHESCEPDEQSCACAECLSRHHRRCWEENRESCASCRGTRRLEVVAQAQQDQRVYGSAIDAWLKLALAYNGGLTLISLVTLGHRVVTHGPAIWFQLIFGAILANGCFLLGPALELFARRFGYRGVGLRWALFLVGFGLAALLALVSCLSVR